MKLVASTGLLLAMTMLAASACTKSKAPAPDPTGGVYTRMSIQAVLPPSGDALDKAAKVITARVQAAGMGNATVTVGPENTIVVDVAGDRDRATMTQLVSVGALHFRKVLEVTGKVTTSTSTPTSPANSPIPTISGVTAKLGPAWTAAQSLTAPVDPNDPQFLEALKPFGDLTPAEVATLPVEMQFRVPAIGCAQLDARPANSIQDTNAVVVACAGKPGSTEPIKYLLDIAKVGGPEVKTANISREAQPGVMLTFTPTGQTKWTALTREAFNNEGDRCTADAVGSAKNCLVAIVLDNNVISAPEIQAVITGDALISGSFSVHDAKMLAAQIGHGALPIAFHVVTVETVRL